MKALKFECNLLILYGSNTAIIALDEVLGGHNLDRLTHVNVERILAFNTMLTFKLPLVIVKE
jgi:hypothetical protein